nr:uncharacterized protein LOC116651056 isoform X2 [Drosophila virilis]
MFSFLRAAVDNCNAARTHLVIESNLCCCIPKNDSKHRNHCHGAGELCDCRKRAKLVRGKPLQSAPDSGRCLSSNIGAHAEAISLPRSLQLCTKSVRRGVETNLDCSLYRRQFILSRVAPHVKN